MTERMRFNQLKGTLFLILFVVLLFKSMYSHGQHGYAGRKTFYRGLQANFGSRSLLIESPIQEINGERVTMSGGQVGIIIGNEAVRSRIGVLGYYSSGSGVKGTMDLYQTNAAINVYPLAMAGNKASRLQPYLTGSLSFDRFKFFGYYLQEDGKVNYSRTKEPHIGTVKQVNATAGAGIEFKLFDKLDFVHFFSEVRMGKTLSNNSANDRFNNTVLVNQVQFLAGLSFGAKRR